MKTALALAMLMVTAAFAAAQDKMADQLRKAIVEEEASQNLDKAIQAYQSILAQFDEERKAAATALFRMAECYRKQGKTAEATAAYKRVVQEFRDQTKLVEASRNFLPKTAAGSSIPADVVAARQAHDARLLYRKLLLDEIALVEGQIQQMERRVDIGTASREGPEMTALKKEQLELRRTLAAFDAGVLAIPREIIKK